jgi:hypothetical protein
MTLFCGEDLNFGAFLKYFFLGVQPQLKKIKISPKFKFLPPLFRVAI